mmetsp:Transcript_5873/g.13055  ORF Transcript_5873/g.13055 Transcript_5873/m.13055 type:complete len:83 (+) Transcript_5873:1720-1968(+)
MAPLFSIAKWIWDAYALSVHEFVGHKRKEFRRSASRSGQQRQSRRLKLEQRARNDIIKTLIVKTSANHAIFVRGPTEPWTVS